MPNRLVIGDSDSARRHGVVEILARHWEICECDSRIELLQKVRDIQPTAVLIGKLTDENHPTEAAAFVRNMHPAAVVIIVADWSSEGLVLAALRAGVREYFSGPVTSIEIAEAISQAAPEVCRPSAGFEALIGASKAIRGVKEMILRVAKFDSTVLVTGESGTGKEIVARLLHQHSARSVKPFVSLNCAAIPETLVESELFGHERGAFTSAVTRQPGQIKNADHGTLFLDEIGDMTLAAQAKVLRVLEQHEIQPLGSAKTIPVDIRLIAATHQDLESLIAEGAFRQDLYYRLDVVRIHLPPLRDRADDIPLLASHFLVQMNQTYRRRINGFTPAAMDLLMQNPWPGNVRQLRNVIEAAAAVCVTDRVSDTDLRASHCFRSSESPGVRKTATPCFETQMVKPDKDELLKVLEATHWNMTQTAQRLNWSRSTLYRNMARHKIDRPMQPEPSND